MIPESDRARALFFHRFAYRLALAAGNVFAWIVVYRVLSVYFGTTAAALAGTVLLYTASSLMTLFLTPLTGAALRHGVRRALAFGTLFSALSFGLIAALFYEPAFFGENLVDMLALFVFLHGIGRALYWIPYRTEEDRGSMRSPHALMSEMVITLLPALAGYGLAHAQIGPFFVFTSIFIAMLASVLFLLRLPESHEPYAWSYRETFAQLFLRRNHSAIGLFIFDGMQGAALLLVWPLAAFLIVGESFQSLGAIMTATLSLTFIGRWLVRRLLHVAGVTHSPTVLASIVFSSWIMRLAAGTPLQLLAVDVYYHTSHSPRRFSIDPFTTEQTADGGHFVDEYTAIKEMSLAIGRILICLLFAWLVLTTSPVLAFGAALLVAALSGAASVFLAHRAAREAF